MLDDAPDIKMAMAYGPPPWTFPGEPELDYYEEEMKEQSFYENRADAMLDDFNAEMEYYGGIANDEP